MNFLPVAFSCFVAWKPGLLAFYGVIGLFILINCILYICICSSKDRKETGYMDEMMGLNPNGQEMTNLEVESCAASDKSSMTDTEYKPMAQMAGIILFMVLYMFMWASAAFGIALPVNTDLTAMDSILSYLYLVLCVILGVFVVIFYCLARRDTRRAWVKCSQPPKPVNPPRSNINIITQTSCNGQISNAKQDIDSASSVRSGSCGTQPNPLMQIMQYHKKSAIMSVASSNADQSVHGIPEEGQLFYNPRQNGIAKKYWEKKRGHSRDRINSSILSVPSGHHAPASPANTEPAARLSVDAHIQSHMSKQAKRQRIGSTNSEPADVRNNIYHSMPKAPDDSKLKLLSQSQRTPAVGQAFPNARSDVEVSYRYPPDIWQRSLPRHHNPAYHTGNTPLIQPGYMKQSYHEQPRQSTHRLSRSSVESAHKQAHIQSYIRSMTPDQQSDEDSRYSHHSQHSRHSRRTGRHRHRRQETEASRLSQSAHTGLNQSRGSLNSHGTARSHRSSRSCRSHRHRRGEEKPLLSIPPPPADSRDALDEEVERLNINHSSSDNNSTHYACSGVALEQKVANNTDIDVSSLSLKRNGQSELSVMIPEEKIYENAHKVVPHELPVYENLEALRQQVKSKMASPSSEVAPEYELPVYENLFSLNEYDTLRKQKNRNKNLSVSPHQWGVDDSKL